MKKRKKIIKKPSMPGGLKRPVEGAGKGVSKLAAKTPFKQTKTAEEKMSEALSTVPRITNETLSEHREEVLRGARKYIYPLQHSKHRVVKISVSLLILGILAFFLLVGLSLYKFQSTSGFIYDVTKIVPFPVAKAGDRWISYESYLFELRRNMHYYQTQQQATFKTKDGKAQLTRLKQQAMSQVIQDAYVKELADQNGVRVTDQQVSNELEMVRQQNRLGGNNRVFKEVLNEFWGWSETDFRRELKQQMLKQAVVAKLDTKTDKKAQDALKQLKGGADFGKLAGQVSEDPTTKGNGGQLPAPITPTDHSLAPAVTAVIFKIPAGQTSDVINTGYTLEIVKVIDKTGDTSLHAAHIQFNLADINTYTKPVQQKNPSHQYIKF
jgi:parvulin-like peptidyl-prolyl isomerase